MSLSVCATPIGNLDDITLRVLQELREVSVILAEDTRHTRVLLDRHGVRGELFSVHEHNERERAAQLVPRLLEGERMALVSDAGLPGISDPGGVFVREAIAKGVSVTVLPGPSAVETALVASGLVSERYAFVGFLPRGAGELAALWEGLSSWRWPVVAFESPRRLPATLRSLASSSPEREVAVCRELTKRFEEVTRGTAAEVAERYADPPKGEITIVVGPSTGVDDAAASAALETALAEVALLVGSGASRKTALAVVARLTGISRNALYAAALQRDSEI